MQDAINMSMVENVTLLTFRLDVDEGHCGWPGCCPGRQPKFLMPEFLPAGLADYVDEEDIRSFMAETEAMFHRTGVLVCPLAGCFCLPFAIFCALFYCKSKRTQGLEEAIKKFNSFHREQGVFLELNQGYHTYIQNVHRGVAFSNLRPGVELRVNLPQRRAYCEKKEIQFKMLTAEPPEPVK